MYTVNLFLVNENIGHGPSVDDWTPNGVNSIWDYAGNAHK